MYNVYILQSINYPARIYKGFTKNKVNDRLNTHNQGNVTSTRTCSPWRIIFVASFETQELALRFEKYLKSASGIAFMRKRLIISNK